MMNTPNSTLRKAAVLIRSLDPETAAGLLGQLSTEEAASIRQAVRELGPIDAEEQADVLAEFRRRRPLAEEPPASGVELAFSAGSQLDRLSAQAVEAKRFQFLEQAPIEALVPYLAREHAQTIAVVLSHLPPGRAAAVLARLPQKIQAETIERMTSLGDSDPESVTALERELAAWVAKQRQITPGGSQQASAVSAILQAIDPAARHQILSSLRSRNPELEETLARPLIASKPVPRGLQLRPASTRAASPAGEDYDLPARPAAESLPHRPMPAPPAGHGTAPPRATYRASVRFDDLINLDGRTLAAVLEQSDPRVLSLALAGSYDELIERICDEMPRQAARAFRRKLAQMGPTRLSDVEAAQHAVAEIAARQIAARRRVPAA